MKHEWRWCVRGTVLAEREADARHLEAGHDARTSTGGDSAEATGGGEASR